MGYDASPFKVRPCYVMTDMCQSPYPYMLPSQLPDPQVAIDEAITHWHVMPRGGGDNRGARDMERWRSIALSTARCEHGRMQDDRCLDCPTGWSPPRAGQRIGTAYDGRAVVVPVREQANDPSEWVH